MQLSYTDEQAFLREAVRGTVDREAPLPRVREWVLDGGAVRTAALAEQQGWCGIGVSEDAGGQGGGLMELTILAEELGRGAVPADDLYATLLAARLLAASGEDVSEIVVGAPTTCVLLEADRPGTPGGGLVLGAPGATRFVGVDGTVHTHAEVTEVRVVDPTRRLGSVCKKEGSPVFCTGVAVDAAVIVAADALGACQRMLDLTVEYVKDRVQFGVPVGSFQAVKHAASEMLVAIEGARSAVQYAAWSGEPLDAWVAKAHASRAAQLVADKALFLHGAVGYTWEHDLQLLIKRAKSDAQLFGGPGAYDDLVADGLELSTGSG